MIVTSVATFLGIQSIHGNGNNVTPIIGTT